MLKRYLLPFALISLVFYVVTFESDSATSAWKTGNTKFKSLLGYQDNDEEFNEIDLEEFNEVEDQLKADKSNNNNNNNNKAVENSDRRGAVIDEVEIDYEEDDTADDDDFIPEEQSVPDRPLQAQQQAKAQEEEEELDLLSVLAPSPEQFERIRPTHLKSKAKPTQARILDDSQYVAIQKLISEGKRNEFFLLNKCPVNAVASNSSGDHVSYKGFPPPCKCPAGWIGRDCSIKKPCPSCSLPDIVLLGTQKGGTTNLISAMSLHSSRWNERRNNVNKDKILLERSPSNSSFDYYFTLFQKPENATKNFTMSGSAGYYSTAHVPGMLYSISPDFKLNVLFRNPVSRMDSNIKMTLKKKPDSLHADRLVASTKAMETCLSDGLYLVKLLDAAMESGIPAEIDFKMVSAPIKVALFRDYNRNLDKLKALKQLIIDRGIDYEDYLSFRLACQTIPHTEPFYSLYKSMYYYHMLGWFIMFPMEQCLMIPSEVLFESEQAAVDLVSDFIDIPRHNLTESQLQQINLNNNAVVTEMGLSPQQREMLVEWFRPYTEKFYKLIDVRNPHSRNHYFDTYWKDFQRQQQ